MRYNRSVSSSKHNSKVTTSSSRPGIHQPGGFDGGRRCQSAHARPSQRSDHRLKQVRSHSQEPKPSSGVPIPQNGRVSDPSEGQSVEKTDLTRMYDYATWNMYERIVNARRKRLSWLDAHQQSVDNSPVADASVEGTTKAAMDLHKVHSREDSSLTSTTVDDGESDKSSATLSSASSSASSVSSSNMKRSVFSLGAIKATICQETQEKHSEAENEEQDHFIFEMDL